MKKFIYQDPRRPRFHSRPIDEGDSKARQILEGGGWRVVETIDDGAPAPAVAEAGEAVSVETAAAAGPAQPKKGKGKQAPAAGPAEPKV
jgi:hypothetical protein